MFTIIRWIFQSLVRPLLALGALLAAAAGLRRALRREADITGDVVLITGGSRGLGLQLAYEFARHDCRIVICGRDPHSLRRAERQLHDFGADVLAVACDVTDQEQVESLVQQVRDHFGPVEILVNNAGAIDIAPLSSQPLESFEQAMDVMYWGTIYPTLAVLPEMRARRYGRIVNVTSIGGKASIPHLMPYSGAKFAAVGFSEGLRAELAGSGVLVTTIVPGLMRTGSFLNAFARGQRAREYAWFSVAASLPLLSMEATQAARQIVEATRRGEAERTLTVPAQILARLNGLFPGLTADINGLANRLLPGPGSRERERGLDVHLKLPPGQRSLLRWLTALGWDGALRLNQLSPAEKEAVLQQQADDGQGARLTRARRHGPNNQ